MKTKGPHLSLVVLSAGILFMTITAAMAQTSTGSNTIPIVTIQATDNHATWAGKEGVFTITRSGNLTPTLNVYCCISGTASNGLDYQAVSSFVSLPAGVRSNTIVIHPIDLGQTDIKTVTVSLCPSPLMNPVNYETGTPDSATVFITPPAVSNLPPAVKIVSPTNGATYLAPTDLTLLAKATDADGTVSNVEFYANDMDLGAGLLVILDPPGVNGVVGPVYFLAWSKVPPGNYSITAVASDNDGASTPSTPMNISVLPPPPPPTNRPPVVHITSPPNGAVFHARIDLPLFAYAFDPDGTIATVEFTDGTNSLGFAHLVEPPPAPLTDPVPSAIAGNFWELTWSNAPVGIHALTALAADNSNAVTRSLPIIVTIFPCPPVPTNHPAVVNIVASDPIAVEGTNSWPWPGLAGSNVTWSSWMAPSASFCMFTNCGPKNATFTVHRRGDTNDDLTVTYEIGGTASNGVDYVTLPGTATIPAGELSALINIVPIDDGPPDITSTVRLRLTADTNLPPAYQLGFPRTAVALILDGPKAKPGGGLLPDDCFHFATTGPDGARFHIEYTEDLLHWLPICTNQVVNGRIDFIDPEAPTARARFYRAVPEADAPLNFP